MGWVVGSCLFGLGCLGLKVNRTGPIFFDLEHTLSLSLSLWKPWQKALPSSIFVTTTVGGGSLSISLSQSRPLSLDWSSLSHFLYLSRLKPQNRFKLKLTGRTFARAERLRWSPIYDDLRPNGFTGGRTQRTEQERLNIFLLFFPLPCPGWTQNFFFSLSLVHDGYVLPVPVSDTGTLANFGVTVQHRNYQARNVKDYNLLDCMRRTQHKYKGN